MIYLIFTKVDTLLENRNQFFKLPLIPVRIFP